MPSSTVIGDSQQPAVQPQVGDLQFPLVTQADVEDVDSSVNNSQFSGKRAGAVFLMSLTAGGYDLIVAEGPAVDDDWNRISDASATPITPA